MNAHGVSLRARGMHCSGCEHIIEEAARELAGVRKIKADYPTETVSVSFDPSSTTVQEICAVIARKGYRCAPLEEAPPRPRRWAQALGLVAGILGIALIILLDTRWISQSGAPDISQHMSFGLILSLGLLTGFHCIGMCGGFVLSYAADDARVGRPSYISHLLYGAGKTLSYTLIGATFGLVGAIIAFTPLLRGIAGVAAGAFLIIFGLNMLNLFQPLRRIRLKTPEALERFLQKKTPTSRRPFVIGLLNGFMLACGPLQAMYVMAAGTGSAVEGAKMLFSFGVGTLPVLLSFGVLTTLISASLTHRLLRASGVIIIILGAVMINRGLILTGAGHDLASMLSALSEKALPAPPTVAQGEAQTIYMDVSASGYSPNYFILRKDRPVKWVIDGKEVTSCNHRILVPKLGLEFDVASGRQTIEFTPRDEGLISWSCWMGMLHGEFLVVGAPDARPPPAVAGKSATTPVTTPSKPADGPVSASAVVAGLPANGPAETPPRPAEEPAAAPVAADGQSALVETYKIQPGDSLVGIAVGLYRDRKAWRDITRANPGLNPRRLRPGQIINLPRPVARAVGQDKTP
ncbi:sulfite exporter TauE/SafE family protein [Methylocapsa acidiphila]|uniref:urease accessory protein UreH domain-containing protein n=1 Tax=Methylocapsa acidiphila TaxID=133552 RepID=UPI00040DCECA|nr:sulfite exporter TauE/SafE family protein [Methylocapsa acidiphila]